MRQELSLLILEDGTVYAGRGFGSEAPELGQLLHDECAAAAYADGKSVGEVVFNTAMSG